MKKIIYCLCLTLCILSLTGCGNKKALSVDEVKKIVKKDGYSVNNNKSQYEDYDDIKEALVIFNSDGIQLEFYVLDSKSDAYDMFKDNRDTISEEKAVGFKENSSKGLNYHQYTLTNNGTYSYISQIGKTLLLATVSEEDEAYIMNITNKLGY